MEYSVWLSKEAKNRNKLEPTCCCDWHTNRCLLRSSETTIAHHYEAVLDEVFECVWAAWSGWSGVCWTERVQDSCVHYPVMMLETFKRQRRDLESLMIQMPLKLSWRGMWSDWEFGFMVFVRRSLGCLFQTIFVCCFPSVTSCSQFFQTSIFPVLLLFAFGCFSDSARFSLVMLFLHLLAPHLLSLPFSYLKCQKVSLSVQL